MYPNQFQQFGMGQGYPNQQQFQRQQGFPNQQGNIYQQFRNQNAGFQQQFNNPGMNQGFMNAGTQQVNPMQQQFLQQQMMQQQLMQQQMMNPRFNQFGSPGFQQFQRPMNTGIQQTGFGMGNQGFIQRPMTNQTVSSMGYDPQTAQVNMQQQYQQQTQSCQTQQAPEPDRSNYKPKPGNEFPPAYDAETEVLQIVYDDYTKEYEYKIYKKC